MGALRYQVFVKADGKTLEFAVREDFTGLLAPLFDSSIADLQPSFDAFGVNLKSAAEAQH